MKLRPYQILAGLDAKRVWRGGVRGVVLCLPTGAGKTVTAYNLVAGALASGERVLWLPFSVRGDCGCVWSRRCGDHQGGLVESRCTVADRIYADSRASAPTYCGGLDS